MKDTCKALCWRNETLSRGRGRIISACVTNTICSLNSRLSFAALSSFCQLPWRQAYRASGTDSRKVCNPPCVIESLLKPTNTHFYASKMAGRTQNSRASSRAPAEIAMNVPCEHHLMSSAIMMIGYFCCAANLHTRIIPCLSSRPLRIT